MTSSFRLLKELIVRLSIKELSLLKKKIEINVESPDKNKNKSKQLLKLVSINPAISQIEVEKELYGQSNKIAFNKLIERAIEKIEEILISFTRDVSTQYSNRNYTYFFLKRKLLILQMYWLRGITFDLEHQLNKIITVAEKYELQDILIDALYAKQRFVAYRFGKAAFNRIGTKIQKAEFKRKALTNARSLYLKMGTNQKALSVNNKDEIEKSINVLKLHYKLTGSPTIKYYLYYLQVERLTLDDKFREAEVLLNRLLKLVLENPSIYTKVRHSDVVLNLATNEIYLKEFSLSIKNSLLAQSLHQNNSEGFILAKEFEFYARFYNKEFEISEKLIEEIYNFSRSERVPFFYGRRTYLHACIKTIRGEFEKSNELLQEVKEIEKDKGGWNLGMRMLAIINGIESADYENVELKVQSLEKFLKRISKTHEVRKRDKVILRILLKLINENFDYSKVYKQRKKYFDLLESDDKEHCWKIKSPELIIFHEWFKKKLSDNSNPVLSKVVSKH